MYGVDVVMRRSISNVLLALVFAVPLLNYLRLPPIPTFHAEALSAFAFCFLLVSSSFSLRPVVLVQWRDFGPLTLMAVLIVAQMALGYYQYPLAWFLWLCGLFALGGALALVRGISASPEFRFALVARLSWVWVLIAVLNVILQWLQALGWAEPIYPFIFLEGEGADLARQVWRPAGNVAQANQTNTVMWLAVVAAIYLWRKALIRPWVMGILLAVLLSGSALSGSRMAWLFLLAVVASLACSAAALRLNGRTIISVGALLGAGLLFWTAVLPLLYPPGFFGSSVERVASGSGNWVRIELLRQAAEVWLSAPWIGVGGGQFMGASFAIDTHLDRQQPLDAYPHNLLLHILSEFGVIGLLIVLSAAVVWGWKIWWRRNVDVERWPAIAWISILLVHSMLEYPLWYFYFLVMFGFSLGVALGGADDCGGGARVSRWMFSIVGFCLLVATGYVVADYRRMESAVNIAKLAGQMGGSGSPAVDELVAREAAAVRLHGMYVDHAVFALMAIDGSDAEAKAAKNARLLKSLPAPDVLSRQILIEVREGHEAMAQDLVRRMYVFWPSFAGGQLDFLEKLGKERPSEFPGLAGLIAKERETLPVRRDGLPQGASGGVR